MMWEACAAKIKALGGRVVMDTPGDAALASTPRPACGR